MGPPERRPWSAAGESDARLSQEVAQLWGGRHHQVAPQVRVLRPRLATETIQETDKDGKPVRREVTRTVQDAIPVPLASSRELEARTLPQVMDIVHRVVDCY